MKATGIVRNMDQLGRIVIPKELRVKLDIAEGDPLEIYTDRNSIILKKYETSCVICGETEYLVDVEGKKLCSSCIMKIREM